MLRNLFVAVIIANGLLFSLVGGPFYALLFYLWNAYFRPEQWLWSDWVSSLRLPFMLGIFLPAAVLFTGKRLRFDRRFIVPGLFVTMCTLSAWYSIYPESWSFLLDFLKVALITYLITVLVDDLQKFRWVLLTIAFSLGLEGAKQGWANLIRSPGLPNTNPLPFLGDNNGVALGMLMLLALVVALAQSAEVRWEKRVLQFTAIGVCIRAIVTYSRGGFLSAGALALFYLMYSERRFRALFGIAAICLIVVPILPNQFWDRMESITASADPEQRDESTLGRLHFWEVGKAMGDANPLLGVGFNAFKYAYSDYDPSEGEFGEQKAPHSSWFGVLGEVGYPGLALYVLMIVQTLWLSRRASKRVQGDDPWSREARAYGRALMGCMIVAIVGGTFLHIWQNEMLWHIFGLAITLETIVERRALVSPKVEVAALPTTWATVRAAS